MSVCTDKKPGEVLMKS